jgi:hypothetical protein
LWKTTRGKRNAWGEKPGGDKVVCGAHIVFQPRDVTRVTLSIRRTRSVISPGVRVSFSIDNCLAKFLDGERIAKCHMY